jgi:hypothetical protein
MNDDNHNTTQDQSNNNNNHQNNNKTYNNKNQINVDNGYDKNANNQISFIDDDGAPNLKEKLRHLDLKNSSLFDGGMWALASQLQYAGIHLNTYLNVYMFIYLCIYVRMYLYIHISPYLMGGGALAKQLQYARIYACLYIF